MAGYFNEPLDFEPVFTDLYPPDLVITRSASTAFAQGLEYYPKFQLMHPTLVDLAFEVESAYFDPAAFFRDPASAASAPSQSAGTVPDGGEDAPQSPPLPPGV